MRVIAGAAGGIPLESPKTELRPTMDKVKAAIFSSLGERIVEARLLDLFAGTGALGIEALSRGAAAATFVENDSKAVESIRRNLLKTRLKGTIVRSDVLRFLNTHEERFDLILADPPYAKSPGDRDFAAELLAHPQLPHRLAPDGIFILEKDPARPLPAHSQWHCLRARRYGKTEVVIFTPATPAV